MLKIEITNDETGTGDFADYEYTVRVGNELVESGKICGHNRRDGWRALLVYVCTPPQFRSALRPAIVKIAHLTQRAPDAGESAPLQSLSTPEADTPAEHLSTPPTNQ